MMIGGKIEDLQILINYYGKDATVKDILTHVMETGFDIFEAQSPEWDRDLF